MLVTLLELERTIFETEGVKVTIGGDLGLLVPKYPHDAPASNLTDLSSRVKNCVGALSFRIEWS